MLRSVEQAVTDASLRARAAELGRAIRSEPEGIGAAVDLIERAFCPEARVQA